MNKEQHDREVRLYTAYAEELRERFARGILNELVPYAQFVVWRHEQVNDKLTKPPYNNPRTHRYAHTNDPSTWGTLDQALKALATSRYNGIGFVLTPSDPFSAIDLDHCVHTNRFIDKWAQEIIADLHTYTEYSPRDGIHLLTKARLPGPGRKGGHIELYDTNHYLTLTLAHVPGTPRTIEPGQIETSLLYATLAPRELWSPLHQNTWGSAVWTPSQHHPETEPEQPETPDEQVIHDALQEKQSTFARYWQGGRDLWRGLNGLEPSKSEADFVLVLMLLTRTNNNEEQTKRLFRQSGLYDPAKTDCFHGRDPDTNRPVTYLEMTVRKALRLRKSQE